MIQLTRSSFKLNIITYYAKRPITVNLNPRAQFDCKIMKHDTIAAFKIIWALRNSNT